MTKPDHTPETPEENNEATVEKTTADPLAPEELYAETDPVAGIHDAVENENAALVALQAELAATKDKMMRVAADAENTRKRAIKEREDASKFAVSAFAKDLLEVSDNLRRALDAMPEDLLENEPRLKNLTDGIEATERTLLKTFEKHGIEKLEPLNEPFNPNFHEVMFEAPVPGKPAGIIMQVLEPGYILNGRLIRPARVGITKDSGTDGADPGGTIDIGA